MNQLDPQQRSAAIALLEGRTWGDMHYAVYDVERALRLALEATARDLQRWQFDLGPRFELDGRSEYDIEPDAIDVMTSGEKLAYVAQLVHALALHYGVGGTFGSGHGEPVAEVDDWSPAALLRSLNEIAQMPRAVNKVTRST